MPIRFRKIFSLGKGFRINLSKGGMSSSIGSPGFTLNIGKRGMRPTIGVPGSGLSFTPSAASSKTAGPRSKAAGNLLGIILSGTLICCITVCCLGALFMPSDPQPSPTATAQAQSLSIDQIIALTFNAAQAQTQAVSSPLPTFTPFEYTTPSAFYQPTLAPTWTPNPTETPLSLPLVTYPADDSGTQCICDQDAYNCSDSLAKTCFTACNAQGAGDIHRLDQNSDGVACEDN